MLTMQAIFNRAVNGVLAQGGPSVVGEMCAYRSRGGILACGVGHLIGDQEYDPSFDMKHDTGVMSMLRHAKAKPNSISVSDEERAAGQRFRDALLRAGVDVNDAEVVRLLGELQLAHDMAYFEEGGNFLQSFKRRVSEIAEKYGWDK